MQSQEPPAPDGDPSSDSGPTRHRRRRTDPPMPPDGTPLIRRPPAPRTVAEFVSRRGSDTAHPTTPPPPWAQDRADPDGRLEEARAAQADARSAANPESIGSADEPPASSNGAKPSPAQRWAPTPKADAPPSPPNTVDGGSGGDAEAWPAPGVVPEPRSADRTHTSAHSDVAAAPDLSDGAGSGGALGGRATAWFDDRGTASRAAGAPPPGERGSGWSPSARTAARGSGPGTGDGLFSASVPEPAGTTRVREVAPEETGSPEGDEPASPPPPPIPSPRPSPSPRRFAPDVVDSPQDSPQFRGGTGDAGDTDGPPVPPVGEPNGHGDVRDPAARHRDGRPGTTAAPPEHRPTESGGPDGDAAGSAGPVRAGDGAAGRADARPVAETRQETTGPVLDRPLRDGDPSEARSTGLGAGRPDAAPGLRRGARTGTDRSRTVIDAARERGLPVRDLAEPAAAPGTGHGHGHTPATPAGKRVRVLLAALLVPCALAALAGVGLLWPGASPLPAVPPQQQVHGTVQGVQAADCTPGSGSGGCSGVTIRLADGPRAGSDLVQLVPAEPSTPRFAVGDDVVLAYSGGNPDEAGSYQITDFERGAPLVWLAAAFAVAVLALGRWRGLAALVALGLSFAVLVWFVLPSILSGNNPLAVAVTGAGVIMFVVLYLSHGFSARTSCAVLGTLVSLALIGGLGALFTVATRLTGLDDTTTNLIGTLGNVPIDARGLVLAGLVIGALGVLDDVTVTQASAVWEVRDANATLGAGKLFAAGMRIGRDHVSSAVNTLVLAYAGAALPLMLLFTVSSASFTQVVTSQDVATEIVRTLVGSIGLVASVPLTTGLAAVVAARR